MISKKEMNIHDRGFNSVTRLAPFQGLSPAQALYKSSHYRVVSVLQNQVRSRSVAGAELQLTRVLCCAN